MSIGNDWLNLTAGVVTSTTPPVAPLKTTVQLTKRLVAVVKLAGNP